MNPLAQAIAERLPWLLGESGFRIVYEDYSQKIFGNCIVDLDGPGLRLRLVEDRRQIIAYVAALAEPEKWLPMDFVLDSIYNRMPEPDFGLVAVGKRLRENLPALATALGAGLGDTKRELERRETLRLRAIQSRVRPPVPLWFSMPQACHWDAEAITLVWCPGNGWTGAWSGEPERRLQPILALAAPQFCPAHSRTLR